MSRPSGLSSNFKTSLNASKSFKPPSKTNGATTPVEQPPAKKPRLSAGGTSTSTPTIARKEVSKAESSLQRVSGSGNVKAVYNVRLALADSILLEELMDKLTQVMYRTPSSKKNKTWEADGVLVWMHSGNHLVLKNLESGKECVVDPNITRKPTDSNRE